MKAENAETRQPNREAIAAYRLTLGLKSGKSKEADTESSDEEAKRVDDDDDDAELDFLDFDDDNKRHADKDEDEEDAERSEDDTEPDDDEDEMPAKVSERRSRRTISRKKKLHAVCFQLICLLLFYLFLLRRGWKHQTRTKIHIKIYLPGSNESEETGLRYLSNYIFILFVLLISFTKSEERSESPDQESQPRLKRVRKDKVEIFFYQL